MLITCFQALRPVREDLNSAQGFILSDASVVAFERLALSLQ